MKLYVADYLGDTHHLGVVEHGAYLLLLMAMWRAGGTLPAADANLARVAHCTPDQWAEIRGAILPFFRRRGGRITHGRLSREMAKYDDTSGKRSEAGKRGASEKASRNKASPSANALAAESNCQHNQNQNQKEEPPTPKGGEPAGFEKWWSIYPRKTAKASARKAYAAAIRKVRPEILLAAVAAYPWSPEARFIPHPATWLNGERWDDESAGAPQLPLAPADQWERRLLRWRMAQYWNSEWGPKPGKPGYLGPPLDAEEKAA